MKNKIFLLFLIFLTSCTESVDLIVHNAKIYSADELNNRYSSFAVKEGKFVYVGGDEILSNFSSANIIKHKIFLYILDLSIHMPIFMT